MRARLFDGLYEVTSDPLEPIGHDSRFEILDLDVNTFAQIARIRFLVDSFWVLPFYFCDGLKSVSPLLRFELRGSDQIAEILLGCLFIDYEIRDYDNGNDRLSVKHQMAVSRTEEHLSFFVVDVEFHEVMRERVVRNSMLGVHPLAVHDEPIFEEIEESILMDRSPLFEQGKLFFSSAAGEVVPTALKLH